MASASSVGAPPAQRPRLRKQVSGRRPASKRERLSQRRSDLGTDQRNTRQHTNGLDEVLEYGADATYQRAEGERLPSDEDDAGAMDDLAMDDFGRAEWWQLTTSAGGRRDAEERAAKNE